MRSISLYSLNRVTRHRKESLFIDVKNQRVFLKSTSNSPITPVNVRYRLLRQRVKKIPILTPLWIIRPRHNKDLSSTGAMASQNQSYTSIPCFDAESRDCGRIISVSDDITYYSPTALPEQPRVRGMSFGPNFEADPVSLPADYVYIKRQPIQIADNRLTRVVAKVEPRPSKSFFKNLREGFACFCCFGSD